MEKPANQPRRPRQKANTEPSNHFSKTTEERLREIERSQAAHRKRVDSVNMTKKEREDFSAFVMSLWRVYERYGIQGTELPLTNFVLFGPQTAGKSTCLERFITFPVTHIKEGIATKRPLVVNMERDVREVITVWEETEDGLTSPVRVLREEVRAEIERRNDVPNITDKKIFLSIKGPTVRSQRFIDLMGYQLHGPQKHQIEPILRQELANKNTFVIAISNEAEYEDNSIHSALQDVLGHDFEKYRDRIITVINKSDERFRKTDSWDSFVAWYHMFAVYLAAPIVVGSSVALEPNGDVVSRAHQSFDDLVAFYKQVDDIEAKNIQVWEERMHKNGPQPRNWKTIKDFMSFETLRDHIDATMISRDINNLRQIKSIFEAQVTKLCLKQQQLQESIKYFDKTSLLLTGFATSFIQKMRGIMTSDASHELQTLLDNEDVFETHGFTLDEEFDTFLSEYYVPAINNTIGEDAMRVGIADKYRIHDSNRDRWMDFLSNEYECLDIQFSNTPMLAGDMYTRAMVQTQICR